MGHSDYSCREDNTLKLSLKKLLLILLNSDIKQAHHNG